MPRQRLKTCLPYLAIVGAAMVLVFLTLSNVRPQAFVSGSDEARERAFAAVHKMCQLGVSSVDDPRLSKAVERLLGTERIATVWLFDPAGKVIYAGGSTAASVPVGALSADRASLDVQGVFDTLPADALSAEDRTLILAASAIRREWTHNDLYRHVLLPIRLQDGKTVALVGIAYGADARGGETMVVMLGVLLGLGGFFLYWLSLPLWVFFDAQQRGLQAWAWAVFVLLGNVVALLSYLLIRSPGQSQYESSPG